MKSAIPVVAALAMICGNCAFAVDGDNEGSPDHPMRVKVSTDMRFDFDHKNYHDGPENSGFHGRYFNLHLNGSINEELSFSIRQRLNKFGEMRNDVFGATDWAYLDYSPTERWTFSGGKQVVAIGGYEYDRNPINIYYASMFWNNIACYQFGVSATCHLPGGRHNILAQVCNSPYQPIGESCYAYNLMWMGSIGAVSTIWSTNIIEYTPKHYGNIISLGTRADFCGGYAELDLMNRYWGTGHYLLGDCSAIGKVCLTTGKFDVFAKGGYERFSIEPGSGATVDKPFYGLGAEFYPIAGSRDLRLHAVADITHDAATGQRCTEIAAGLMWRVTIFNR